MMKDLIVKARELYAKKKALFLIAITVCLILLPQLITDSYPKGILCRMLLYATLAGSLNVICGYSGMFCLGHIAFFCLGAYTEAILSANTNLPYLLLLVIAGAITAIAALIIFFPIRNLDGHWLSLVTIGFSEIVRLTALNWTSLTGGSMGMKDIARPVIFGYTFRSTTQFYYLFLVVAILFVFVTTRLVKSRVGYAWMSIREDQLAARSLGVEVMQYKATNFLYGTFWAGVAGALYAPYLMYIDPTLFTLDEGFSVLCMVLIGGLGSILGPIAGAILVVFLTETLRVLGNYRIAIYGLVIILVMWVRPEGIFGAPIYNMPKAIHFKRKEKRPAA
ncbi:MAG: branched-chain amino acid ABC transporter permease [Candidatus Pelethousia sp.]|nr:branched-chain amino acid ABC transporter permease [Candidatus Pelethousia sp.]